MHVKKYVETGGFLWQLIDIYRSPVTLTFLKLDAA